MSLILRVAALVLFAVGILVGAGWITIDASDWQPVWVLLFAGLFCWCASEVAPPPRT